MLPDLIEEGERMKIQRMKGVLNVWHKKSVEAAWKRALAELDPNWEENERDWGYGQ